MRDRSDPEGDRIVEPRTLRGAFFQAGLDVDDAQGYRTIVELVRWTSERYEASQKTKGLRFKAVLALATSVIGAAVTLSVQWLINLVGLQK